MTLADGTLTFASAHDEARMEAPDILAIRQRIEAQMPVEVKMARARYVIWTEGSLEVHAEQWRRIVQRVHAG